MTIRRLALVLLLGAGWMPHTHADHDGGVAHIESAHGSHGIAAAAHDPRLPAGKAPALIVPVLVVPMSAPLVTEARRPVVARTVERSHGRDPPPTNGPRAPPTLST
jgi:hypothetical protein